MVVYSIKNNSWHCPCAGPRQSCIHKATAKCHLFEARPELFNKMEFTESEPVPLHSEDVEKSKLSYPPETYTVRQIMKYMLSKKKVPGDVPKAVLELSCDRKACNAFPWHLVPTEVTCVECKSM